MFDFADDLDALGFEVVEEAGELEPGAVDFGEVDQNVVGVVGEEDFFEREFVDDLRERDRVVFRHYDILSRGRRSFQTYTFYIILHFRGKCNPFSEIFHAVTKNLRGRQK